MKSQFPFCQILKPGRALKPEPLPDTLTDSLPDTCLILSFEPKQKPHTHGMSSLSISHGFEIHIESNSSEKTGAPVLAFRFLGFCKAETKAVL